MKIKIKRVYEKPSSLDGKRILVDRLWPRGLTKVKAEIYLWMKEIAPGEELRKWFGHEDSRWDEFKKRYIEELKKKKREVETLSGMVKEGNVTLVYGAKDEEHNNAVVLREFLEKSGSPGIS